ncbi:GGDEF domain-containing protein [Lactobacillus delbrueckii]|uniref:GGDEF domain-containing protein n=1 Tax=Lactobacillus delbrueckii TaxID=1584 RepID=UPI0023E3F8C5|nr:GGDEF domain-containing protein [Lactobacillus delbrueckii]MDF4030594.1 GGDEF domain-containing protein [Lactobacillus delbrueckii]
MIKEGRGLALLENSNVGLFWKNGQLEYLGANQRFLDYFGLKLKDILGLIMDVTSQMDELNQLQVEAARDPLTTLKNRHSFDRDFVYLTQRDISVMMIDIDYFKTFNDKFGHLYGDAVLKKISEALLHVYGIGHCHRYGGDEFLVIEDFESKDRLRRNDRKVREYLKQVKILDLKFDIHISAGCVYGQAQTQTRSTK